MSLLTARDAWRYIRRYSVTVLGTFLLAACTVGPDYKRPAMQTPAQWRTSDKDGIDEKVPTASIDSQAAPGWQVAQPSHAPSVLNWWAPLHDAELDALEQKAMAASATLQQAAARYGQARAVVAERSSASLPEIDANGGLSRDKTSEQRPRLRYEQASESTVQNDVRAGISANYEIDLFGRVRRDIESAQASASQSADDLANARLVLSADLATHYVDLRSLDSELDVLERTIDALNHQMDVVNTRHRLGMASQVDVLQQQDAVDGARTQLALLAQRRAQYADAIAALIGVPAPSFNIAPLTGNALRAPVPLLTLDPGVPSTLLQRRPDIASAERAMAAANARIGVAKAAYFPDITLGPQIGWESTRFATMMSAPALLWSIGTNVSQVLFDGGRRRAAVSYAQQDYLGAEANYRQSVLDAFREVQDAVSGLAALSTAAHRASDADHDSEQLLLLARKRYDGGEIAFIDVLDAEQRALNSERQQIQIRSQQASLSIFLAKALGGGWKG